MKSLNLSDKGLKELPSNLPERVFGCDISKNYLTSLKNSPKYVEFNFYCWHNKLKNLEGAPERVDGDFVCSFNELESLKGLPKHINGRLDCRNNHNLKFLDIIKYILRSKINGVILLDNFSWQKEINEFYEKFKYSTTSKYEKIRLIFKYF